MIFFFWGGGFRMQQLYVLVLFSFCGRISCWLIIILIIVFLLELIRLPL